jgi:hypothetical protein
VLSLRFRAGLAQLFGVPLPESVVARAVALSAICAGVWASPRAAYADDSDDEVQAKVVKMAERLRNENDFRVRTQAALALGATKHKKAVEALCSGLDDSNTSVRAAAAAALGKLALGGLDCLKSHRDAETSDSVKSILEHAIEKVQVGSRRAVSAETKYYVAVGPTTDKTGRSGTEVDDIVHASVEESSSRLDRCVIAPRDEKTSQASTVLKKWKHLHAFFLWPKVMAPDYSGGKLTLRFEIAIFTYPGKALKGTIPVKLTMPDVDSPDKSSENDLIGRAAATAFEQFSQHVADTRLE